MNRILFGGIAGALAIIAAAVAEEEHTAHEAESRQALLASLEYGDRTSLMTLILVEQGRDKVAAYRYYVASAE